MELKEAIKEIRNEEKRKFVQGIDLIVNLRGIDIKRDNISAVLQVPHKISEKRIAGFLAKKSDKVESITQADFVKYKDKKDLKRLVNGFDFFIAHAKLMPSVATAFGKVLGPAGKMPSPQLGVLMQEDESAISQLIDKINKSIKIRLKEPSFKILIGKENMSDSDLEENILAAYNGIVNALPTKKENVKSVMIKMTMGKPVKVEIK